MSIINNAYAGSQIPLTCMIYRVLSRNDGQLTVDEITALCAPANLTVNENQRKKFRAELNFWMKKEHQLWYQNSESKLCLVDSKVESTPSSIATIINSILYASPIKDLFDKKTEHVMRDLVIFLGCILSHDRYLPYSSKLIESSQLDALFTHLSYGPNDNEKQTLLEYGVFLGFLEQSSRGYVVDPTRVVTSILPQIFSGGKELVAKEFVNELARSLPLLDGGVYRLEVETEMRRNGWEHSSRPNQLSKVVSYVLERLRTNNVIEINRRADDRDAVFLQYPKRQTPFSTVSMRS
jgi:hypothetical protein